MSHLMTISLIWNLKSILHAKHCLQEGLSGCKDPKSCSLGSLSRLLSPPAILIPVVL